MKRYKILYSTISACFLALFSCTEYLDMSPESGINSEDVYSEYYAFQGAVDRGNWLVQNYVFTTSNWGCYIGAMGDEQQASKSDMPTYKSINQGVWMGETWRDFGLKDNEEYPAEKWTHSIYYNAPAGKSVKAIRAMGLAIQNIEQLKDFPAESAYSKQEMKDQLLGEAYALRAWHYFEVIRRYGPMLLVNTDNGGREPFPIDFDFDRPRPTWQECADLIAADCDEAARLLPLKYKMAADVGRVTKASALAIKGMVYMYAASPLMNTEGGKFPFGQDSYSKEYAKKGVEAMCATLKLIEGGQTRYELYPMEKYLENWMSQSQAMSDEALFQPASNNGAKWALPMNGANQGVGWFHPQHDGGWAVFNVPTQNAVDKFETINGYPVTKFASNDPEYDPANPYKNRDPRLKMFVFCPGDEMYLSKPDPKKAAFTNEAWSNPNEDGKAGFHYDYYRGKSLEFTGYFARGKWRKPGYNQFDNQWNQNYYRMFPHIRVADMYLGLAELANEVYGPAGTIPEASGLSVQTAEQAINKIRNRVNMPNIRTEFTADVSAFRDRVRNEWAVEFYGEFRRWKDIRRWRIAKKLLNEGIYAAEVVKKSDGSFSYSSKRMNVPRVFENKHYWYPFDTKYIDMFTVFKQNPGW